MQIYGSNIGQQRNCSRALDGMRQGPLMFCTATRYPPGDDFSTFGNKMLQRFWVLVVDDQTRICTEAAYLAPVIDAFFSSWPSPGSAGIGNHFICSPL
jgi:hypothetical protein